MKTAFCLFISYGLLAWDASGAVVVDSLSAITHWTGEGDNRAVILIDWKDEKNLPGETLGETLAWGYRWPAGQARTGRDALRAIAEADPRLTVRFETSPSFGEYVFGIFYDLDGDGGTALFDPVAESGGPSDLDDHFAEGWRLNGYWSYVIGASTSATRPGFALSGSGDAFRTLSDGSWDAWVFNADFALSQPAPGIAALAPIPEPSAALALPLAAALFLSHRRPR
jgi:hypothetical protein